MSEAVSIVNLCVSTIVGGLCLYMLKKIIDDNTKFSERLNQFFLELLELKKTNVKMEANIEKVKNEKFAGMDEVRAEVNIQGRAILLDREQAKNRYLRLEDEVKKHEGLLQTIVKYMKKINDRFMNSKTD